MSRQVVSFLAVIILVGCHLPEREAALIPLPEGQPVAYVELLARARAQATTALEAFYVDGWTDVQAAAAALEQTARLLPKSTEIPTSVKERLAGESEQLRQDAIKLGEAARAKNAKTVNETLQRISLRVRDLRVEEKAPPPVPAKPKGDD
jgi:hypothetical protein